MVCDRSKPGSKGVWYISTYPPVYLSYHLEKNLLSHWFQEKDEMHLEETMSEGISIWNRAIPAAQETCEIYLILYAIEMLKMFCYAATAEQHDIKCFPEKYKFAFPY